MNLPDPYEIVARLDRCERRIEALARRSERVGFWQQLAEHGGFVVVAFVVALGYFTVEALRVVAAAVTK